MTLRSVVFCHFYLSITAYFICFQDHCARFSLANAPYALQKEMCMKRRVEYLIYNQNGFNPPPGPPTCQWWKNLVIRYSGCWGVSPLCETGAAPRLWRQNIHESQLSICSRNYLPKHETLDSFRVALIFCFCFVLFLFLQIHSAPNEEDWVEGSC